MAHIKNKYIEGKLTALQAARMLSAHNGNPLPGNLQIVQRWRA